MPDRKDKGQPETQTAETDEGCPVRMFNLQRCGRSLYLPSWGTPGGERVCLMHSTDPHKNKADFQEEFERTLAVVGNGVANLAGFVFPTSNYRKRRFAARCIFNRATFIGPADFMGAIFTEPAIFSEAIFSQGAYFLAAEFMKDAVFAWAKFIRGADFSMVRFMQEAKFHEATFAEDANFSGAKFAKDAYFSSAIFMNNVVFNLIRPMMPADSGRIANKKDAPQRLPFIATIFGQRADFRNATFRGRLEFRQTQFREDGAAEPGAIFSMARFDKPELVVFCDT